jgi:hypothetical protein
MKKGFVLFALLILLAGSASAYTLADYPRALFAHGAPTIVVGKTDTASGIAANIIALDLWRYAAMTGKRQDANIVQTGTGSPQRDEIVIGTPCGNARVRELMNIPSGQCNQILTRGQGQLTLYQDDYVHLLVTGGDNEGVLNAAKVLVNGNARQQLNRTSIPVVRAQRVVNNVAYKGSFLSIGQTIGAAGDVVYGSSNTIIRSTTLPKKCSIITRTLTRGSMTPLPNSCPSDVFHGGYPSTARNVNVLGTSMWIGIR